MQPGQCLLYERNSARAAIKTGSFTNNQRAILPDVFQLLLTTSPAEPLLLWSNGPWLTLLQTWERPFEQHDLVDFAHCVLSLVAMCFLSNLWEARVDADAQVRTVDSGSHFCAMRLYLCDGRNGDTELRVLIATWSLEPYGLQVVRANRASRSYDGPHQCSSHTSRIPPWTRPSCFLPSGRGPTLRAL